MEIHLTSKKQAERLIRLIPSNPYISEREAQNLLTQLRNSKQLDLEIPYDVAQEILGALENEDALYQHEEDIPEDLSSLIDIFDTATETEYLRIEDEE